MVEADGGATLRSTSPTRSRPRSGTNDARWVAETDGRQRQLPGRTWQASAAGPTGQHVHRRHRGGRARRGPTAVRGPRLRRHLEPDRGERGRARAHRDLQPLRIQGPAVHRGVRRRAGPADRRARPVGACRSGRARRSRGRCSTPSRRSGRRIPATSSSSPRCTSRCAATPSCARSSRAGNRSRSSTRSASSPPDRCRRRRARARRRRCGSGSPSRSGSRSSAPSPTPTTFAVTVEVFRRQFATIPRAGSDGCTDRRRSDAHDRTDRAPCSPSDLDDLTPAILQAALSERSAGRGGRSCRDRRGEALRRRCRIDRRPCRARPHLRARHRRRASPSDDPQDDARLAPRAGGDVRERGPLLPRAPRRPRHRGAGRVRQQLRPGHRTVRPAARGPHRPRAPGSRRPSTR